MCLILGDLQEICVLEYPVEEMKFSFSGLNSTLRLKRHHTKNALALGVPFMNEFVEYARRQSQ